MRRLPGTSLLLLAFHAPLYAQAQAPVPFEGTMQATFEMSGTTVPLTYALKGHHARIDMQIPPTPTTILIDSEKGEQIVLVASLRAYLLHRVTLPVAGVQAPDLKDEGTTETVAGHTCEDYHLESERYVGTICFAKDLPSESFGSGFGMLPPATQALATLRTAGMPLKVDLRDVRTAGTTAGDRVTMEITAIDAHAVNDSSFAIPDGWHRLDSLTDH